MWFRWRTYRTCATSHFGPRTTTSPTWASSPCGLLSSGSGQFYCGVIIRSSHVLRSIIVKKADSIVAVARYVPGVRLYANPVLPHWHCKLQLGTWVHITLVLRHFLTTKAWITFRYNTSKYYDGRKEVKFISLLVGVIIIIIIVCEADLKIFMLYVS